MHQTQHPIENADLHKVIQDIAVQVHQVLSNLDDMLDEEIIRDAEINSRIETNTRRAIQLMIRKQTKSITKRIISREVDMTLCMMKRESGIPVC